MTADTDAPKKARRKRRRRWLLWLVLPLLGAGFGINYLLQPDKLGELLLTQLNQRTGLHISTSEPAHAGWYPELHVSLRGLDARLPGDDAPLLEAESLDLSLPLSLVIDSIRGSDPQPTITGLTLRSPKLDLIRLQRWMGNDEGPPAPFMLPAIDSPLRIESGTVLGDGWRIEGLDIELDELHAGQPSRLTGKLNYLSAADEGAPPPLAFDVLATLAIDSGSLDLSPITVDLQSGDDHISASGKLRLDPGGTLQAGLVVALPHWPKLLPALPLPPENQSFTMKLDFDGMTDGQGKLALDIQSDADRIDGELLLGDWLGWLGADADNAWLLPPVSGSLKATRLQQGDVILTDAEIDFDDGATAPAGAAGEGP
ncbi:MAG: hypothetical protein KDI75_08265 [Xanthomonadales bacterium]|nr:hypothetical protein [Xanthomonadales bacterium]